MHILRAKAKNFMKLKTIDLELDNGVIKIAGKNRAGKSTVLKLIEALGGKNNMPEQPLKDGERKGYGELHLGDETGTKYIVNYSLTKKDTYLKVEQADGEKIGSPAKLLSSFLSDLVDPWRFVRMATGDTADRKKACKILKELMIVEFNCGEFLDKLGYTENEFLKSLVTEHADDPFSFLKALDEALCDNRREWKQSVAKSDAMVKNLKAKVPPEMRDIEPQDISELIKERDVLNANAIELNRLNKEMIELQDRKEAVERRMKEITILQDDMPAVDITRLEKLDEHIANASTAQEMARDAKSLKEEASKLEKREERVSLLDDKIEEVREQVEDLRETAHMPVDNMRVEGDKIMLNGLPFTQASRREQLCASIDVAMALEPMLNVFVCHDASLLDAEGLAIIDEKQKEYGSQILLEVVQDEGEPGVIFVEDDEAVNT